MEIVIDIPRKTYEHIRADGGHGYFNIYDEDNRIVTKAVFNGTPLPKGHGRIIDEDKIGEFRIGSMCKFMTNAPTIIEGSESE